MVLLLINTGIAYIGLTLPSIIIMNYFKALESNKDQVVTGQKLVTKGSKLHTGFNFQLYGFDASGYSSILVEQGNSLTQKAKLCVLRHHRQSLDHRN